MTPALSPAETAALRRAFTADRAREASADGRVEVVAEQDRVVLRRGDRETEVAGPDDHGTPGRPSLSADGSRVAYVRTDGEGHGSVEVMKASSGVLGRVSRMASWRSITPMRPPAAVDLSEDGSQMAYISGSRVYVEPTAEKFQGNRTDLPPAAGLTLRGTDVEVLPGGRVAVETDLGTYFLVEGGQCQPLSLRAFDPSGWEARREEASRRLPGLPPAQLDGLLETFGTAVAAAHPSPDGARTLLHAGGENLLLEHGSGRRLQLGTGPDRPPAWSPDGAFLALDLSDGSFVFRGSQRSLPLPEPVAGLHWAEDGLSLGTADGRTIPLGDLFPGWDLDMGTGLLGGAPAEAPRVIREPEAVVIGEVRLPVARG